MELKREQKGKCIITAIIIAIVVELVITGVFFIVQKTVLLMKSKTLEYSILMAVLLVSFVISYLIIYNIIRWNMLQKNKEQQVKDLFENDDTKKYPIRIKNREDFFITLDNGDGIDFYASLDSKENKINIYSEYGEDDFEIYDVVEFDEFNDTYEFVK